MNCQNWICLVFLDTTLFTRYGRSWNFNSVTCCDSVKMASTGVSGAQLPSYMITYTHVAGDDVNGRPVYRNGKGITGYLV